MKIKNDKKSLFFLARPFIDKGKVKINKIFEKWGLDDGKIELSKNLEEAHVLLIPYDINHYFDNRHTSYLENIIHYVDYTVLRALVLFLAILG